MKNLMRNKRLFIFVITISAISLISLFVLGVLVGFKTINANWIYGWGIGIITMLMGTAISITSVYKLFKNENHYLYYLFFLIRFGLYIGSFLMVFFIFNKEDGVWIGLLIGLIPVLLLPTLNSILIKENLKNIISLEEEER
ncbi:MG406 family protein [Mesoplasma photuris]|uniref:MG406 family protein n=1 Tax=Mesoplasma photuris TaxID=217731 RepID=UPI0004E19A1A|nr:MG406 family protein [Mesoplasma photuris]